VTLFFSCNKFTRGSENQTRFRCVYGCDSI